MMSSKTKQYEMDMCSGPILRKMLMFALPLMLSSILQLLFNAADIVVVGKFAGDNSLAAVGSNTALINLLTNLFIGLSIGANVVAARHYGAKAWDDLRRTVHTAMLLSMLSGALLLVLGVIGAEQMLIWMQTPEEVLPLATVYLRIYFLGMISTMVYNFGSALLRAVGDTKRPLYFLLCAGIINVILNLLFVIGFQMDVMGVAIATVISETVSALLVLRCLVKEKGGIHLELRAMRIDRKKMLQILRIGLPAGFQGVVFALSNVLLGEACVIVTGTLLGNMVVFFGNDLLQIYSNNPEVIAAGMVRLHYISMIYALCGIMDVMVGALRGIGYSIMPMIVSIVGVCVLRLIWLATVFQIPEFHKIETVYLSYPVTWILTSLVYIVFFVWIRIRSARKKPALSV